MLLKPIIPKVNSLPLVETSIHSHSLVESSLKWGGLDSRECEEYRNTNGRLLILGIVSKEQSIRMNKRNHDTNPFVHNSFNCTHFWYSCKCDYSKRIRALDMNIDVNRIEELKEIL